MNLREHIQISKRALKMMLTMSKTYTYSLIFGSFLSAVAPYIPIYFSAKLIDALYAGDKIQTLVLYAALAVGLTFFLSQMISYLSSLRSQAENEMYRAESWMFSDKAMDMAYESIEDRDVKLLLERIKKETQTGFNRFYLYQCVERIISNTTQITASVSLTLSFFLLPSVQFYLKLLLIGGIILTIACSIFSTKKSSDLQGVLMADCVDANIYTTRYDEYTHDYSAGKDIRLYGMADVLASNMEKYDRTLYEKFLRTNIKQALISLPHTFFSDALKFGTYLVLISAALAGTVTVGSIAKYVSCLMLLLSAVTGLVKSIQLSFVNHTYLKRYFSYFDIPNKIDKGSLTVEKINENEYFVEFCNVSFKYPNTEAYALRHVNIELKVGEKLAVVGMNGSGKTTFVKLLCRLYDPNEGEILLNGINVKRYDYDEYMRIFSVVFQDFKLFPFPLGQNVAASLNYDNEKVVACLEKANFSERLKAMPEGTETYLYKELDENGVEISGGEAQRIALARALYKDAPFIVLDEPTSALDPVAEAEVYKNFNNIVGDKTAIYISHRLSSCRFCDNIIVFDEGKIVQRGSHETLVADESGKYFELWHAQAQYYAD